MEGKALRLRGEGEVPSVPPLSTPITPDPDCKHMHTSHATRQQGHLVNPQTERENSDWHGAKLLMLGWLITYNEIIKSLPEPTAWVPVLRSCRGCSAVGTARPWFFRHRLLPVNGISCSEAGVRPRRRGLFFKIATSSDSRAVDQKGGPQAIHVAVAGR